jgi:hypothetical protein
MATETLAATVLAISVGVLAEWMFYLKMPTPIRTSLALAPLALSILTFCWFPLFRWTRQSAPIGGILLFTIIGLLATVVVGAVLMIMVGRHCRANPPNIIRVSKATKVSRTRVRKPNKWMGSEGGGLCAPQPAAGSGPNKRNMLHLLAWRHSREAPVGPANLTRPMRQSGCARRASASAARAFACIRVG